MLKQLDYLYGDQILRNFISTVTVMCNEMAIRTVSLQCSQQLTIHIFQLLNSPSNINQNATIVKYLLNPVLKLVKLYTVRLDYCLHMVNSNMQSVWIC